MKRKIYPTLLATLAATAIGNAYSATVAENDALGISNAKISIIQAVTAAETYVGGKAARVEYEHENGQWIFDVDIVKDKIVWEVAVDSISGKIITAVEDTAESDDVHDRKD